MNQKCRYCAYCIVGNVAYCELKNKVMSDASAKRLNKCAEFEFNPMDAYGVKDYQEPRAIAKDGIELKDNIQTKLDV